MFEVSQRRDKAKREQENRKRAAMAAFNGFRKLLEVSNGMENIRLHINEGFDSADKMGASELEPFIKIMPFVGASGIYNDLIVDEIFFLTRTKSSDLISEIDLVVRRARNNEIVISKYSELRQEMNSLLEAHVGPEFSLNGTLASTTVDARAKMIIDLKGSVLNNVLGTLMDHLERDCDSSRSVCARYLEAAKTEYKDDFPKFQLEWAR